MSRVVPFKPRGPRTLPSRRTPPPFFASMQYGGEQGLALYTKVLDQIDDLMKGNPVAAMYVLKAVTRWLTEDDEDDA